MAQNTVFLHFYNPRNIGLFMLKPLLCGDAMQCNFDFTLWKGGSAPCVCLEGKGREREKNECLPFKSYHFMRDCIFNKIYLCFSSKPLISKSLRSLFCYSNKESSIPPNSSSSFPFTFLYPNCVNLISMFL